MEINKRLAELRYEIECCTISYKEIIELESLAQYIDKDDIILRSWAGLEEETSNVHYEKI